MSDDDIYAKPQTTPTDFVFDQQVVNVFEDMIRRSVPGYSMMLELIGLITQRYVKEGTNIYDLGCSLGASTFAIVHNLPYSNCSVIAIDKSEEMIEQCRRNIAVDKNTYTVDVICCDVMDAMFNNASLVVMNLTLQFIPLHERETLVSRLYSGLNKGGILVLSEKIMAESKNDDEVLIDLFHDFKRKQGYSDLEVAQKRDAIENILIPETLEQHRSRLLNAGFSQVIPWFQSFNFMSLIAIK
jgi:tRNA (cmo5U34)-methyltransferase